MDMDNKSRWDKTLIAASGFLQERKYWLNKLQGEWIKTCFPYDYAKGKEGKREITGTVKLEIPQPVCVRLMELSTGSDARLHMILTAALVSLLNKYTGTRDAVVGTTIDKQETDGDFINTVLPLRIQLKEKMTFKELLLDLRRTIVEAIENQNYPMETLMNALNIEFTGDEEEFPLFDTVILFENIHDRKYLRHIRPGMIFLFSRPGQQVSGQVEYNSLRYSEASITRIIRHFNLLLQQVLGNIDVVLEDIRLLSREEMETLIYTFNDTRQAFPADKSVPQLFEEQVQKTPHHIAIQWDNSSSGSMKMTYRELNEQANRLAQALRAQGLKPGGIAAIALDCSMEMVLTVLAVLKAGGAYLPIDPVGTPTDRIRYMLEDTGASLLLINRAILKKHSMTWIQDLQRIRSVPRVTRRRPRVKNLDTLPFPDRSLVDYQLYNRFIGLGSVKKCMGLQATRGCPFSCAFCHITWPKSQVRRSAENLFQEVKMYFDCGIRRFSFMDDIFNLDSENTARFFRLIIKHIPGIHLIFAAGLRGDILTRDYIDLMAEAGVMEVNLSLETASPRLQKLIGKNLNIEKLHENIRYICDKYPHILLGLETMLGIPTETKEEAMMTLDFIKSIHWIHFPYINILKIYPNTEMEKIALENGFSRTDILKSEQMALHEVQDSLPFDKSFALQYQADFLNNYFLSRERLRHVLSSQMKVMTEDELVRKYQVYLPVRIDCFADILEFTGISPDQLDSKEFSREEDAITPGLNKKLKELFTRQEPDEDALRVLLLDLSQYFTGERQMLNDVTEAPLGLMYVLTYLHRQYGPRVNGKIAKSRADFDNYGELKRLLEDFKPQVIGIRTIIFYKDFFHETTAVIRQWGVNVPVIAGGPYATSSYETLLQDRNIDLAVLGDGEITFSELIGKIMANRGKLPPDDVLGEIPGLAFIPAHQRQQQYFPPKTLFLDLLARESDQRQTLNPEPPPKPLDPAYLIFTSGSTGKPKGVMVHHQGLVNYTCWAAGTYAGNGNMSFPFYMPMSFDLTVTSVYVPLLSGNTIIVYGDEAKELLIQRILDDNQVDIIKLTPAHLKLIRLKKINHSRVKRLICGGEELETTLAKDIYENFNGKIEIYNEYGPTETVVGCICHQFDPVRDTGRAVPIGHPIANTQIYLLDSCRRPVPAGVAGEIYISGAGVAPGYVNRPEITAQRFITSHMSPGQISYRTGDLGKFLPDGNIEFLGRIDHQVNIHGFRIELGEIESRLSTYDKIKEAVVLVKEGKDDDKSLCAYWVPAESTSSPGDNHKLDLTKLREFLSLQLPYYMIPSLFVRVDKIPLTPSGKVDKKHLLKMQPSSLEGNYEAPRNEVERKLTEVWSEVLDVEKISINDNLFEMGGDSIKTIQIAARLRKHKINVEISEIFSNPSIKELSTFVQNQKEERVIEQGAVEGEVELTPAQQWLFEGKWKGNPHVNQAVMLYRKEGFRMEKVNAVFEKIVRHHDALRMVYEFDTQENRVIQRNRNIEGKLFDLEVINIEKAGENNIQKAIQKEAGRIQEGIDLARGPLVKLGLFKTETGDHLLIVIHHLVVDGVSWRIILEDFSTGYELAVCGEEITFPDKTDSFKYWAQKLKEYAAGNEVSKELPYWEKLETAQINRLPRDNQVEPGKNKLKHTETRRINLTEAETRKLLKEVHHAYNTEINDILLTALAAALNRWEGLDKIAVTLEGHGREPIMDNVTISRTVGYYTANFPVLLDISQANTISERIKTLKESLRKIPNKGIGYGILKYLTPEQNKRGVEFLLEPEISFNYLGQFGQELKGNEQKIEFSPFPTGDKMDPELQRLFVLDVTGIVTGNKLTISFAFNRNEYKTDTIERLAQCYYSSLIEIIQHCSDKSEPELTPSDLTKNNIGMDELKNIMEKVSGIQAQEK